MRIRVLSRPPLPHIQAWFVVPDRSKGIASSLGDVEPTFEDIYALKNALRNDVPGLRSSCLSAADLILMIDGFELLDQSGISVIKDGDLVTVHINSNSPNALANHQSQDPPRPLAPSHPNQSSPPNNPSTEAPLLPRTQKKRKRDQTPSTDTSSYPSEQFLKKSRADLSSDSSSSFSSDSSSSPSSDSSSSPSSSSSSSSSPSIQTTNPVQVPSKSYNVASAPSVGVQARPVPPGQGKPSTHNRNLRRRVLRALRRESQPSHPPDTTPSFQPNEARDPISTPQTSNAVAQPPPSYSLKNKNKRRGFKEAMASLTPKRIDFKNANVASPSTHAQPPGSPSEGPAIGMTILDDAGPVSEPQSSGNDFVKKTPKPRVIADLVPPSRRKDLPANVVVTVVDVESDKWKNADAIPAEPSQNGPLDSSLQSDSSIDWSILDSRWNDLTPLDSNALAIGDIVAWQELGLDYTTFCPKLLVTLGRITGKSTSPNASSSFTIERLTPLDNQGDPDTEEAGVVVEDVSMELTFDEMKLWRLYKRADVAQQL